MESYSGQWKRDSRLKSNFKTRLFDFDDAYAFIMNFTGKNLVSNLGNCVYAPGF
ncbi:hypothetical protein MUP77_16255 [Candidatus Bathyarchaeota archaeon]|nr:hypothetical protein [Candidatus Bathyarchaeota archaeon]